MEFRRMGHSGTAVAHLCLGTMTFGAESTEEQSFQMMDDYAAAGGRDGDLGTSVGPPTETLPGATAFITAYRAAGYREGYGQYGAFSFDAANVVVGATATALDRSGGEWSADLRRTVAQAVQAYGADGVTGPISFDRFGDAGTDAVTVYRLVGGRWIPDRTQP